MTALLLLVPFEHQQRHAAEHAFEHANALFHHGHLEQAQSLAHAAQIAYPYDDPLWNTRLRLLEAQAMLYRGFYGDALRLATKPAPPATPLDEQILALSVQINALSHTQNQATADVLLQRADRLCAAHQEPTCGKILETHGTIAGERQQFDLARGYYEQAYQFAQQRGDQSLAGSVALNRGWLALQQNHYDLAQDWSRTALRIAEQIGDEDLRMIAASNLGWASYPFGDAEHARELFQQSAAAAARLGNTRMQVESFRALGDVERFTLDTNQAARDYQHAYYLAYQFGMHEDEINQLLNLTSVYIDAENFPAAQNALTVASNLLRGSQGSAALRLSLLKVDYYLARGQVNLAEPILRELEPRVPAGSLVQVGIHFRQAKAAEDSGRVADAQALYNTTLEQLETLRSRSHTVSAGLPLVSIGIPLYSAYIHFLVDHGQPGQALFIADQSRARTLAQGLGQDTAAPVADPRPIARRLGATLLFYWLGRRQSYLWVITPSRVDIVPLPTEHQIITAVREYQKKLLAMDDPLASSDPQATQLFRMLVGPAASAIPTGSPVVLINDGILSKLNFETLVVPATPNRPAHYWIDDATVLSAPSLSILASSQPSSMRRSRLLLVGNAQSASADYPQLAQAPLEIEMVSHRIPSATQLTGAQATLARYRAANPQNYDYIHFVTHGVASSTDPLDSSIILSRPPDGSDDFKLYAREILARPLHARLVTISACYGSGVRSYAGEGLVGLSWAFLHAGAHNVIGTLWEVSDESTPRLMDGLYAGLSNGLQPAAALRKSKLTLLHNSGSFRSPFFWAPFQLYTGR